MWRSGSKRIWQTCTTHAAGAVIVLLIAPLPLLGVRSSWRQSGAPSPIRSETAGRGLVIPSEPIEVTRVGSRPSGPVGRDLRA
jgi:hypothetical protein